MTVTCKPCGRGNWRLVTVTVTGLHVLPLLIPVGLVFNMGDLRLRVVKVSP